MSEEVKKDKYPSYYSRELSERVRDEVMEKGKPRHKMVYKTINPADNFKGIKASDFNLESLVALGALNGAKECQLSGNNLEASDLVESLDNSVSEVFDNLNEKKGDE